MHCDDYLIDPLTDQFCYPARLTNIQEIQIVQICTNVK